MLDLFPQNSWNNFFAFFFIKKAPEVLEPHPSLTMIDNFWSTGTITTLFTEIH